jgi:hypothetical protein
MDDRLEEAWRNMAGEENKKMLFRGEVRRKTMEGGEGPCRSGSRPVLIRN